MKTFTKFLALLFAFTIIGSMSLNAQPWYNQTISGDMGEDLMEIWVYGASVPAGVLNNGDKIGAFDGEKLVGIMTVSGVTAPSTTIDLTNWSSNRLLVFSKDQSGNDLYEAGNPILLKAYNGTEYYAYTWAADAVPGDNVDINFHNTWYAPTGDSSNFANIGPFFPPEGENSYSYADLRFTATAAVPTSPVTTITFTVYQSDGVTAVADGATVTCAGYLGTVAGGAGSTGAVDVYWATGTINYTFTVEATGHDTEIVTVPISGTGDTPVTVYLDRYGDLSGTVTYDDPVSGVLNAHGAYVSVTIGDSLYFDWTADDGTYLIEDIPDGTWDVTTTFTDYTTDVTSKIVTNGGNTTHSPLLQPKQGTMEGTVYNAVTLQHVGAGATVKLYLGGSLEETATTAADGTYTLTHRADTYDSVSVNKAGYKFLCVKDYVLAPEVTVTENFNIVLTTYTQNFLDVTGDPNNMWSIHIESAKFGSSSLLPYDELAIFDTMAAGIGDDVHVGTIVFDRSGTWQNSGYNVMKAFAVLSTGGTGFTEGNGFRFNAYDVSQGDTTGVPISWSISPVHGNYHGTTFPNLTTNPNPVSYLTINWDFPSGVLIGTVTRAENPNIGDPILGVTVNVLNRFTEEVVGTGSTDANGQYNIPMDAGTYDVKFSVANFKTVTVEDIEIILGETTTEDEALYNRNSESQDYSFDGPGFFFFGRCVESSVTDMTDLFDNHSTVGGGVVFSADYQLSWIENDALTQMTYAVGGNWTNEFAWDLLEGYQLFIHPTDDTDHGTYGFDLVNNTVDRYLVEPEDNPIDLTVGIHYVPYFPYTYASPDDAITAFAGILDSIDWVMNSAGDRLHNDNGSWIDNIGILSPEEGYKIKAHHTVSFTYPESAKKSAGSSRAMLDNVHFIYNDGNAAEWTYTMNINTNDFEIGDEIAAYSNGNMVGSMVIDSEEAWENDLNTFYAAVDGGYGINTPIELLAWDASNGNEYNVEFEMVAINDNAYIGLNYPAGLDHYSYINVYRGTVSVDENQVVNNVKVYPNPTSGTLNIESVSNINQLHIYNIYGALVAVTNVNAKQQQIDVSRYTTGTYLIQLHTDTGVITKRVIIK